jgi:N-acetylmuramoyl-L-alanine amidase
MKRRSLLKAFAVSTGNIALPFPLLTTDKTRSIIQDASPKKSPIFARTAKETVDSAEFTFTVDKGARYTHFRLHSPDRFVIDFYNAGIYGIDNLKSFSSNLIPRVRIGHPDLNTARIVFDLNAPAHMETEFFDDLLGSHLRVLITAQNPIAIIKLDRNQPQLQTQQDIDKSPLGKLRVDAGSAGEEKKPLAATQIDKTEIAEKKVEIKSTTEEKKPLAATQVDETETAEQKVEIKSTTEEKKPLAATQIDDTETAKQKVEIKSTAEKKKSIAATQIDRTKTARRNVNDRIIVIDPGHGGIDPGTIGAGGTKEKDVVLTVAKRLQEQLNKIDGYQAHLTRNGDQFLSLKKRVSIVQEHKANLSISLHVDAFHDRSISGASVYCLNENSALPTDPFVKALVEKENGVDRILGSKLAGSLSRSLDWLRMDAMHRLTLFNARIFGKKLIKSMENNQQINVQYNRVKQADFFILKTPATPSALVEMGFLSNPDDERLIKDEVYQNHLSLALTQGVSHYLHLG